MDSVLLKYTTTKMSRKSTSHKQPDKDLSKQPELLGHYEKIQVSNFRGISNAEVSDLKQLNVFAGKNSVGKTSLLEAIFLLSGVCNPHLAVLINTMRGINRFEIQVEKVFGGLFHWGNTDTEIEITSNRRDGSESLKIWITSNLQPMEATAGRNVKPEISATTASGIGSFVLTYTNNHGFKRTATTTPTADQLKVDAEAIPTTKNQRGIFLTSRVTGSAEDAQRYTNLAAIGRSDDLLPILRIVEPRLKSLQILVLGGQPVLHANLGGARQLPLPFCGDGLSRLTGILLAIDDAQGGVVLIDEFENGLHYSVMEEVWKGVAEFCLSRGTQVFATTHSFECISAAQKAFNDTEKDFFRLHRLDRHENGAIKCTSYSKKLLQAAVESQIEVR